MFLKIKIKIKKREEREEKKKSSPELQKPNVEAEFLTTIKM